jgi:hypothetical protein
MGAFATDQTVCQDDYRRLQATVAGDMESLVTVCERFEVPLLAAAMRATNSVADAFSQVEPTLSALCEELLSGLLAPSDWSRRAIELVTDRASQTVDPGAAPHDDNQTLSAIGSLPRIARRRALRDALPRLSLPELTALLMRQYNGASSAEMVGLAAETEELARQFLAQAEQRLDEALSQASAVTDDDG